MVVVVCMWGKGGQRGEGKKNALAGNPYLFNSFFLSSSHDSEVFDFCVFS